MHIKYWACMVYMPDLMGIFISGLYYAITCEVEIAVVFCIYMYVHICMQNVQSVCSCRIFAM